MSSRDRGQQAGPGGGAVGEQPARTSQTLSPAADPSVKLDSLTDLKGGGTWCPSGGVEGGSLQR